MLLALLLTENMSDRGPKQQALTTTVSCPTMINKIWAAQSRVIKSIVSPVPASFRSLFQATASSTPKPKSPVDKDRRRDSAPSCLQKQELQTKNIKVITRQDLINGTYHLDSPSTTVDPKSKSKRKRSQHRHPRVGGSHSTSPGRSPLSSPSPPTPELDCIDDADDTYEFTNDRPRSQTRHTFSGLDDGTLLYTVKITKDNELIAESS